MWDWSEVVYVFSVYDKFKEAGVKVIWGARFYRTDISVKKISTARLIMHKIWNTNADYITLHHYLQPNLHMLFTASIFFNVSYIWAAEIKSIDNNNGPGPNQSQSDKTNHLHRGLWAWFLWATFPEKDSYWTIFKPHLDRDHYTATAHWRV